MSGRIPQSFIDDLLARTDIVSVIDSRVPLKKAGAEYKACCPFHDEKTPSFTVSPAKQFYYCFGCGANGSALGFLIEYERLDFLDAVEALARDAGIEVPREGSESNVPNHAPVLAVLRRCNDLYRAALGQETKVQQYLRQRGLEAATVDRFMLGYAPAGWDWLMRQFPRTEHLLLEQAGMLSRNDNGRVYDRFRERLMFPISNRRGDIIGFGGRVIGDGEPKYLNSPETGLFHKGRELYGLHHALKAASRPQRLLVVEGYMDVIALAQNGIDGAVATLGTATTDEHLRTLFRHVPEVVFCFDGDAAGRRAARKAMDTTLPHLLPGREARFLFLEQGDDPDSLVQRDGSDAFFQRLGDAMPLADYLFESLGEGLDLASEAGRAALVERFKPIDDKLPKSIYAAMLRERLAALVRFDRREIDSELGTPAMPAPPAAGRSVARRTIAVTPMRLVVALLLRYPEFVDRIDSGNAFLSSTEPGVDLLVAIIDRCRRQPPPTPAMLLESFRGQAHENAVNALFGWQTPATDAQTAETSFDEAVEHLRRQYRRKRREALIATSRQRSLTDAEKSELSGLFSDPERRAGSEPD